MHKQLGSRLLGALLVLALAAGAWLASAPPAAAQAELEVQAGFGGLHEFGSDLVVRVRLTTDRLISGTLQARAAANFGSFPTAAVSVEAAGGTTKEFLLVLPRFEQWGDGVTVTLIEDGVTTATGQAGVRQLGDDELIGVMPTMTGQFEDTAAFDVPLGTARTFAIDQRWLDAGVGAIDSLSSIVVAPADLLDLTQDAVEVLDQWIFQGGTLVVDAEPGLVPALAITAAERPVSHGHGRVVTAAWAAKQSSAGGVLAPAERLMTMNSPFPEMTGDAPWFGGQLASELANDAGFGLPSASVVLLLLGLYILLAGPIAWFVLRRMGKVRLVWSVLPVLALLFTAGVWFAGSVIRSNTSSSHGTIIEIADDRAHATSTILALSRNGGSVDLNLPNNWRPVTSDNQRFGPMPSDSATQVLRTAPGGGRIEVDLAAGQFTTLGGSGQASGFVNGVVATASAPSNGTVTGTVTNNLDVALHEVVVFAGGDGVNVGVVQANATVPFTFNPRQRDRFGEPREIELWGNAMPGRFGPIIDPSQSEAASNVNISLWSDYVTQHLGRSRPLGSVTIAGWTRDLASPLDPSVDSGRTLVVATAPVEVEAGVLTDLANQQVILRSPSQLGGGQPNFGEGFVLETAWRFDVPAGVDESTLGLHLPAQVTAIELWDGTEWRVVDDPPRGLHRLPANLFRGGSLTAKLAIDFDRGRTSIGTDLTLRTITPADTLLDDLVSGVTR